MKHFAFLFFCSIIFSCSSVNDENLPIVSNRIPQSPSNLIGIINSTSLSLSWSDNSNNEKGFVIEKKSGPNSGNFEVIGEVNSNQTNYIDSNFNESNLSQYRVKAFNDIGSSAEYSNIFIHEPVAISVTIGAQVWNIKNLDVVTYRDGTPIPQVSDPTQWSSLTTGAWCYYNNDSSNNSSSGKLYNWYAVAGIFDEASKTDATKRKQLAPIGTIATNDEWLELQFALNSSGQNFKFLNGGYRNINGSYEGIGSRGYYWTSTPSGNDAAWSRTNNLSGDIVYNKMGLSVRYLEQKSTSTNTFGLPEWTQIPDEKFERSLIDQGIDDIFDGKVLTSKVSNLKVFRMEHTHVKNITGIESFVSLEYLFLWQNDFNTINVTKMKRLKILGLSECPVNNIDLTQNSELIELDFQHNGYGWNDPLYQYGKTLGFTSLDLSKNTKIQRIYVAMNRLNSLDVSMLPDLTDLWIGNSDNGKDSNKIESLDLSHNPRLDMLVLTALESLRNLNIKGTNPRRVLTSRCPNLSSITVSNKSIANAKYLSGDWEKDSNCALVE